MHRIALITTLAAATSLAAAAPAVAGDPWRGHGWDARSDQRHAGDWRDPRAARHDRSAAWRDGYRAGQQAAWNRAQPGGDRWGGWTDSARGQWTGHPAAGRGWVEGRDWWQGRDGRYYCRRSDGTTGTIVGAVAGGTLGNILAGHGDKRLGSVIGGTLGAVIGRAIDRGEVRCR